MFDNLPPVIRKILERNKLHHPKDIEKFLYPHLRQLPNPNGMKGIPQAVDALVKAVEQGSEILIWGDYDVDGTTATSLLVTFFKELGIEANWHIPNRLHDGYGINSDRFTELKTNLNLEKFVLITVDCGISNHQEIKDIINAGGEVIVTDHHQIPQNGIPGCIVINPNQEGCSFQPHKLAGVGVAFYLAASLRTELDKKGYFQGTTKPNMKDYLAFVALGTVADLVELTPANRVLVRAGMEVLQQSTIPGLQALIDSTGLTYGPLTTEDISFSLAPRINAAGRLGAANTAVNLMTCDNHIDGSKLSKKLDSLNSKRKEYCASNLEIALSSISSLGLDHDPAIVVSGELHVGVIGIVASKLVEIYSKPAIVFSEEIRDGENVLRGSGRSIDGVHLLDCLDACAESINKYGGHAMAAGLTIHADELKNFRNQFSREVSLIKANSIQNLTAESSIECSIDEIMDKNSLELLMKLEPFGPENNKPVFVDNNVSVVHCKAIGGNGEHLQLSIRGQYSNYRGVGFGLGDRYDDIRKQPNRPISFTPIVNRYRGSIEWQLRVIDI